MLTSLWIWIFGPRTLQYIRGMLIGMPRPANPIPPGFHSLTVHLAIEGAAAYADFLAAAFGAVELARSPGPGGKLMHVQMRIGDTMLLFNDDFGPEFGMPPLAQGRMPFHMHLYVTDADAAWAQAVAAGCQVTMPLADQFWGDRYGQVRDPFGVTWAIATRKEELTPEETQERQKRQFGGA
jgi:PhnB protein